MNRYSSITTSEFNPLSFQEIMAAPLAMRQKHDASIAQAEALRIQANPLKEHSARALELKQQMDAEIAKNVDTLNKEGYNPTTFQNITKLNRQYQDMISPTGEIGQINNAKIVYDKAKEDFIQDTAKQNIGRDQALKLWDKKTNYYTGFGEDGKSITNVSPQGVAAYQDYEKYKQFAKSLMGDVESESRSGGYKLVPSSLNNGTMVMVDSKGFKKNSTNLDALNNAILSGSEMWLKPTGEGYKYNQDAGVDQNNFKQRFIGDFGSMLRTSSGRGYEENGQFINDATGPNGGNGGGTPGTGVIINNDSTLKSDALNYTNYSNALNARKRLMTSNSPKDRAELADLEELQRNADSKIVNDPKYKDLQSKFLQKQTEIKNYQNKYFTNKDGKLRRNSNAAGNFVEINLNKLKNELNDISKQRSKIKDAAWNNSSSSRHSYSYLPTNSQEQTNWDIYNKGVFNTLKGGNLANLLDVSSIHTTNGSKTNVSNTDVNNIQSLLNGADEKSFTINSIKTYGSNKTPEVTMTFVPNKNAKEYTMDRRLFTDYNDYGGAEKPVTVTFRLKDFSNASKTGSAVGYKSLSGAMTDFWKDKGGVNKITNNYQGAEVKDAFVKSEYSKYSNDELNKLRNVDEDANRALQIRYMEYQASKR